MLSDRVCDRFCRKNLTPTGGRGKVCSWVSGKQGRIEAVKRLSDPHVQHDKTGDKMTRKTTGKQSTSAPEIAWGGFIDIRLTEGEEKDFWLWYQTETANILPTVFELVSLGYKFGLSYDPDSDAYLATFTAYGESLIGLANRYCMTARAPQADAAIGLLVYKHVIIADGKWGNYMPRTGKMRNFG